MGKMFSRALTFLFLFTVVPAPFLSAQTPATDEDWSKSPEAYFLTAEEKQEWQDLRSRESRVDFIERYWLKRDPSPGTTANEFRILVQRRIGTADARYRIEKTPGSRTKQGFVFIVFGTPARVQQQRAVGPPPPRNPVAGSPSPPVGLIEGTESVHTWTYDRERTPRLVEALGVPSFTVGFVIEPHRHRDELQSPGLVNEYRERLARKSIVNPDLVASVPASPAPAPAAPRSAELPLSAAVRAILEKAPPQGVPDDASKPVFGSAVLWGTHAEPETVVWAFLPEKSAAGSGKLNLHALVRAEGGGQDVVSGSEPASTSQELPTAGPGRVIVRRFTIPPGNYSGSLALTGDGEKPVASATLPIRVPALDKDLAVSSLLVAAGVGPAQKRGGTFEFGSVEVLPRADAAFARSESLWYFVQLANVSDSEAITQELRLRRGTQDVAARAPAPAELEQLAPGRYAFGYEIPLSGFEPGSYVLYVTVRDGEGHSVLRRADFRVVEAPTKVSGR